MLIPYPLEPPPPLPPLDDPWDAPEADLSSGRRGWCYEDEAEFYEGVALRKLDVLGPLQLHDRRIVALEEPLFVWEVEAEGPLQVMAEVRFPAPKVHYERSADGTSLWLGGEGGSDELLVRCYGGVVEVREERGTIRLHGRGDGRLRLVIIAAWSEEDRDRTLRSLARKGVAGVVAQQVRHQDQIVGLGVKVTTPAPDEDARLESDKIAYESGLHECRDGTRALVHSPYDDGYLLLAFGLREPVRDTLRAPLDDPKRRRLFAAYARWAGADEFVHRHWRRLMDAVRSAERGYRTFQVEDGLAMHQDAAYELLPLAEALGDREAAELLGQASQDVEVPPEGEAWPQGSDALDRWGIEPDALEGAVALAPDLPATWTEMTLERLRVGATTLDVRVRRRPSGVAVKVKVTRGPQIVVHLTPLLPFTPLGVLLGDEQFTGPRVTCTVADEAEATWLI